MNYIIFLFIFSIVLAFTIINLIKSPAESKKTWIISTIIISAVTGYLLLDLPYFLSGGLQSETDIQIIFGFGKSGSGALTIIQDKDKHIFWAGDIKEMPSTQFKKYKNVKISYLPLTRTITMVKQKVDEDAANYLAKLDRRYLIQTDDGYYKIYTYSDDFFDTIIFLIIAILVVQKTKGLKTRGRQTVTKQ